MRAFFKVITKDDETIFINLDHITWINKSANEIVFYGTAILEVNQESIDRILKAGRPAR